MIEIMPINRIGTATGNSGMLSCPAFDGMTILPLAIPILLVSVIPLLVKDVTSTLMV